MPAPFRNAISTNPLLVCGTELKAEEFGHWVMLWLESEFDSGRPTHTGTQDRGMGIRLPRHAHPDPG